MTRILTSLTQAAACLILALGVTAQAQDKKVDPTGTWTFSVAGRAGGTARVNTLKLKLDGEKLTGTLTAPGRGGGDPTDSPISEAKIKGVDISFQVVREFGDVKITTKYAGKIAGDTITGKIDRQGRDGQPQEPAEWVAKKEPAKK